MSRHYARCPATTPMPVPVKHAVGAAGTAAVSQKRRCEKKARTYVCGMRKRSPKPDRVQFGPDEIDCRANVPAVDRWKPMACGEKVENWRTAFDRAFPMGYLPIEVVIGYAALQTIKPVSILESSEHCPLWFPNEDLFPRVNERRLDGPKVLADVLAGIQKELWRGTHRVRGFRIYRHGEEWQPADTASDIDPASWTTLALDHGKTFGQIAAFQIWDQAVERGENAVPSPASQRPDTKIPIWVGLFLNTDDVVRTVEGRRVETTLAVAATPRGKLKVAVQILRELAEKGRLGGTVQNQRETVIEEARSRGWLRANDTIEDRTFRKARGFVAT